MRSLFLRSLKNNPVGGLLILIKVGKATGNRRISMEHGKSVSVENKLGVRRKALDFTGKQRVLAPRHFRKLGRHYMDDVTDGEIASVYYGFQGFEAFKVKTEKSIASFKGQITKLNSKISPNSTEEEKNEIQAHVWEIEKKISLAEDPLNKIMREIENFRNS